MFEMLLGATSVCLGCTLMLMGCSESTNDDKEDDNKEIVVSQETVGFVEDLSGTVKRTDIGNPHERCIIQKKSESFGSSPFLL